MKHHAQSDEDQGVDRNGYEREPETRACDRGSTDYGGQRGGASWRVKRSRQRHRKNCQSDCEADGKHLVRHDIGHGDADQGGNRVPADDRPRLRKRTGRHGEEQNRGGTDGRDDQRQLGVVPENEPADQAGDTNPDQRPDTADQALFERCTRQNWREQLESRQTAGLSIVWRRGDNHLRASDAVAYFSKLMCL